VIISICLRYLLVLIITIISIAAVSYTLQSYFQINIGSSASFVTVMIPALNAGTTYFQKTEIAPPAKTRWAYAFYFTCIQLVLAIIILAIIWKLVPEISDTLSSLNSLVFLGFGVIYLFIVFLVSRLFFGMGINSMKKTSQKL